jgi:hypothetical protein
MWALDDMDVVGLEHHTMFNNTQRRYSRVQDVKIVKFIDQIENVPAGISICIFFLFINHSILFSMTKFKKLKSIKMVQIFLP